MCSFHLLVVLNQNNNFIFFHLGRLFAFKNFYLAPPSITGGRFYGGQAKYRTEIKEFSLFINQACFMDLKRRSIFYSPLNTFGKCGRYCVLASVVRASHNYTVQPRSPSNHCCASNPNCFQINLNFFY